ncbi:uncharacterized protein SPAPADRAFT_51586 [Spathaspora passalidarum NRRL Y-27907]|uniref:UvrD-like helicase ATP-binding domain-containing protein n=1 Tax=Spathaspora passalidarum (strain NRRL Y-27907 / 11-Y1) TaxID=619300 RepID=G3AQP4_SPAPN|nr:uncharacterized protein SPAPADRAFT_51586 [Spathaspora passalidarum NRRL Y-27907]EGW31591.1 hypothetical protein SPAPADRAFT_51586 [Spathaspora passalidarum NRRL Y-27907]
MEKPEGFDELVANIDKSHKEPGNSSIQELVLKQAVTYLLRNKNRQHWFCDEYMYPITVHSLVLFSFPNNPTLCQLQPYIANSLSQCRECMKSYNRGKADLRLNFAINKGVKLDKVNQFLNTIIQWEVTVVGKKLEDMENTMSDISTGYDVNTLYWCLYNPNILRFDSELRQKFDRIVRYLHTQKSLPLPDELLPGTIYMAFEGSLEEKYWVEQWLNKLHHDNFRFTKATLQEPVVYEFSIHLYQIQNAKFYNDRNAIKFWNNFYRFVDFIDDESFILRFNTPRDIRVMSEFTELRLYPVIRLLMNCLLSYLKEPLPVLLKCFNKLLSRLLTKFWTSAMPIQSIQVLDAILSNPEFTKQLQTASIVESDVSDYNLSEISSWMFSILPSLGQLPRQSTCIRMGTFLLNQSISDVGSKDIRMRKVMALRQLGCRIFYSELQTLDSEFREQNFSLRLMTVRDVRNAVDNQADIIVDLALDSEDSTLAVKLVVRCMQYDLSILAHNTCMFAQGVVPTIFDTFPILWDSLTKRKIYSNTLLVHELIKVLTIGINCTLFAPTKNPDPNKQLADCKTQHNDNMKKMTKLVNQLLEKLSLADPSTLKQLINEPECSIAIWSCVFNPQLSQSALDLLNEAFDAGGRLETIQVILSKDLKVTLHAITTNLNVLTQMGLYEPSPKAIRILMDVINALADPLNPILASAPKDCVDEVLQFWKSIWQFLIMVYKRTFIWANQFHLDELVEFTRDTLDLSHLILASYRILLDNVKSETVDVSHTLFIDFMNAFDSVIPWLRLGDLSLLNSCVSLVFKGFELASERNFPIDAGFIETFAKFGAKAKKFNNKLSEVQRQQILSKAREFNPEIVDRVVDEATKHRAKRNIEIIDVSEPSSSPEPAAYRYQSRSVTPKQQTLSRFGVVTQEAPIAPPPSKDYKPSNLEAIRKELKSARASPLPKSDVAPAPPRPAGFNSKKVPPVVGRSLNALKKKKHDSDSSDDELETDVSDLFIDKVKKKPKIVEVDMNLNPVHRSLGKKMVDPVKLEQERMRLRLNVNLKPLYNTILRWRYNTNSDYPSEDKSSYTQVKDTYDNVKDYVSTTEPLLMLECWQGIQQAKATGVEEPFEMLIGTRTSVDGFFDVFASVEKKTIQDRKIGDSDLLVLGIHDGVTKSPREIMNHLKSESATTCLAKVREIKYNNTDYCDITFRVYPSGSMVGVLLPKSIIVGMRVMQMITVEREFSSLRGLQYYDLLFPILQARPNDPIPIHDSATEDMCKKFNLNVSQAKAILGTHQSEGFSLIQGPPGTGKTKTILGIVGYSLSQKDEKILDIPGHTPTTDPAKILICAPSNAAVDELVLRLRDGVKNSSGETMNLKVVRLGRSDAINASVRDLTLEELVDKELQTKAVDVNIDPTIRQQHSKCIEERDALRARLVNESLSEKEMTDLEDRLRTVNKKRSELAKRLDEQRERASIAYRTKEIERRNAQARILSQAQVICSTLSGSAHDFLASLSLKFDKVIVDEACQCVELSAIIPLRYGCRTCIMVGDPNQLPPTVLSQAAASYNYEQSLFVRMQKNHPDSVYLLDVQYRMHPQISQFPSAEFYNSKLKDGEGMLEKNDRPWHKDPPLTPYRFFDIVSKHERDDQSRSLFNVEEARVALELVQKLMTILPQDKFRGRIGIISPYKEQIRSIKNEFIRRYGRAIQDDIDFNTVDGFQGQEKEIIIMSCVRASPSGNVGFLSDVRRMNVALTRARTTLWILGNKDSLSRNNVWRRLLEDASNRDCISKAYPGFLNMSGVKRQHIEPGNSIHDNGSDSIQPKKKKKNKHKQTPPPPPPPSVPKIPEVSTVHAIRSGIFDGPKVPKHVKTSKTDLIAAAHKINTEKAHKTNTPTPTQSSYLKKTNPNGLPAIPTNSGFINRGPSADTKPTSSGTIKPPPKKTNSGIFIQRKKPPHKRA